MNRVDLRTYRCALETLESRLMLNGGQFDPTFNQGAVVITHITGADALGAAVALESDGKIIVGGTCDRHDFKRDVVLARYNANGTLDTSFGTKGIMIDDLGGDEQVKSIALQPNNSILVAGVRRVGQHGGFFLARYTAGGLPDPSFGTNGSIIFDSGGYNDGFYSVIVQPNGKILAAGTQAPPPLNTPSVLVARYNSDGTPDTHWGNAGQVITSPSTGMKVGAMTLQSDGKVIVVGPGWSNGSLYILARYNTDGTMDGAFGSQGIVSTDWGQTSDPEAVAVQGDGKIVVGGLLRPYWGAARYLSNGTLDPSFGSGGAVSTNVMAPWPDANDLAIQSDGKILLAASDAAAPYVHTHLFRFTSAGAIDSTFGTNGDVSQGTLDRSNPGMVLQSDGKIVTAGSDGQSGYAFALARYLPDSSTPPPPPPPSNPGSISGVVFEDANASGTRDSGEAGQANWQVYLDTNGNGQLDTGEPTATTDSTGAFTFSSVAVGSYAVREVGQRGYRPSCPASQVYNVAVASGQSVTGLLFGNAPNSSPPTPPPPTPTGGAISGVVFNDINGDGLRERGDIGLGGWQVYLDSNGNAQYDSGEPLVYTNASGDFGFGSLSAGTYNVREVAQQGYRQTSPQNFVYSVSLSDGQSSSGFVFGNVSTSSPPPTTTGCTISGTIFNDANGNGLRDASEIGVSTGGVFIDYNHNGLLDRNEPIAVTNAHGQWSFTGLRAGGYWIMQILKRGWRQTLPHRSRMYVVTVTADAPQAAGVTFGQTALAARGRAKRA